MRGIRRPTLSYLASSTLDKRTTSIAGSLNQAADVQRLWKSKKNKSFVEIREKLELACRGRTRCMYCEDSEATDIEHFYPKSVYPLKTFQWTNYLLACSNCNSNYKRSQFPIDPLGNPHLLNPMEDNPLDHLDLSLSTGKFIPSSEKGRLSILVFGLDRQVLETGRRDAWTTFCALVSSYSRIDRGSDVIQVERVISALKGLSFSCVACFAKNYLDAGTLGSVAPAEITHALTALPEILDSISIP